MRPITRDDLEIMHETETEDFVLINVLSPEAFNEEHIRRSINIPVDDSQFVQRVESVMGNKDRMVVVYSADTDCRASSRAARELQAAGFSSVSDYEGGTRDWFNRKRVTS